MVKFNKTDVQRTVVATLGALALSATCILAAAGPVRAADRAPIGAATPAAQQIQLAAM